MEHNLDVYTKYYSCGSTKVSGSNEFTREIYHSRRDFSRHWQKLKPEKTQNLNETTTNKQVGSLVPKVRTVVVAIDNHMAKIQV
jgi:hypothetical protein